MARAQPVSRRGRNDHLGLSTSRSESEDSTDILIGLVGLREISELPLYRALVDDPIGDSVPGRTQNTRRAL